MGAICSTFSMACCCAQSACTLCSCCPGTASSTMTRIGYAFFLLIGVILQILSMEAWVADKIVLAGLYKCASDVQQGGLGQVFNDTKNAVVDNFENGDVIDGIVETANDAKNGVVNLVNAASSTSKHCRYEASYFIIYRISFGYLLFFSLFSLLMVKVKSSSDVRSKLQNGFWGIKLLLLIGIVIASLFIKSGTFDNFMYVIGLIAGFIFILWQLVLVIDFAYKVNEGMLERLNDSGDNCIKGTMLFICIGGHIAILVSIILMYVYFGGSGCGLNQFFITFALIITIILALLSTYSEIQEHNPYAGLITATLASGYVIYLTYSSMTSESWDKEKIHCNPMRPFTNATGDTTGMELMNGSSVVGTILFIILVLYSTITTVTASESEETSSDIPMIENDKTDGQVHDDESSNVSYNYSLFHVSMLCGSLYMMMTLTNWIHPGNDLGNMWSAVWIKIVTSWLAAGLYIWSLVAPAVLDGRDF